MSASIVCTRCGATIYGYDEFDAEIRFNEHVCEGLPRISDLDDDLLEAIILGESEENAFAEQRNRNLNQINKSE
jgi:hypothetical protein